MPTERRFVRSPNASAGGSTLLAVALLLGLAAAVPGAWLAAVQAPASLRPALVLGVALAALGWGAWARERAARERVQRALGQCSGLLQETRRVARLGDWEWDPASGEVRWSEEVFGIYGRAACARLRLEQVEAWVHPDDRERLRADMVALVAGSDPFETEFRIVRPDGEVRDVYARAEWIAHGSAGPVLSGIQQDVTDAARARARLREVQAGYQFLFEHNPLPMWVFDRETLRFLAVNDAMLRHYGYTREELLAGDMRAIRPAEDHDAMRAAAATPSDERPQGHVWTHLCKDGSRVRAAIFSRDIAFAGTRARLVAAHDVTERERSEQRFRLVARATSDAVWDWDIEGGTTWRSDTVYPLFGYTPGEFEGNLAAWEERLHPDDRERVMASVQHAIDSGAAEWECSYRLRRKDGSYADVHDRGFLLRDAHGRAIRAVGGMVDMTEKHRDQANLRLLQRTVEVSDNGIVIADARHPDHAVVYVNPAFEHITGYPASEVLGRNCRLLQGRDTAQAGVLALRDALREERESRVVLRNYRRDGQLFWNEFRLTPVRDDDGVLTHFVGVVSDVTERQRYEEQLAWRATHDELTGLPNRQLLLDRLQQAIFHAERYGREVGVVFVDLDDFKLINDSLGHSAGDTALKTIAQRLRGLVRETDTVGRFGGDEFVLVLTEQTEPEGMALVVERICNALAEPVELGGVAHVLTPSIGHCRYPQAGRDAETLLMHADLAMYEAKRQGRNRAVAWRSEFDGAVSQRLQLLARLREALQREEFVVAFQPLFAPGGRPVALEALVRWQHPERGLLPPGEFIRVCEESGLIVELGRYVLREAARHHALLAAVGLGALRIAVNVSAAQFAQDLYADVAAIVHEFALPAGVLELEITESVIMDNPDRAIETMERIATLGVGIAVDDFGTGYSSLAYLKRLPIHRLKIDRSFVQDLGHDADDAAICASIIGLGHLLGLRTVAEGVETEQQREWLHARGCDELQGFLLGRPEPFEVLLPLLLGQAALAPG